MIILAYIAVALYYWDFLWLLMMPDFTPWSRVSGFIFAIMFTLFDVMVYFALKDLKHAKN